MKVTYHFRTDPGRIRELNEDCVLVVEPKRDDIKQRQGDLLIVADGMGGHESGEVASSQAVETIVESYFKSTTNPQAALRAAIEEANAVIFRRARAENRQGMGTTVVAAARVGDTLHVAHVGDSRIYLVREGKIRPLTQDHSLVAEQVAAGIITPEEAEHHPNRNVISRAVGTSPRVDVEMSIMSPLTLREGDVLVLCSDGLTEHVKPERILQIVRGAPPEVATQALVDAANAAGGTDNISVIVAKVGDAPSADMATAPMAAVTARMQAVPFVDDEFPPSPSPARERIIPPGANQPQVESRKGGGTLGSMALGLLLGLLLGAAGFVAWNNFVASEVEPGPTATVGADLPAIIIPTSTLHPTVTPTTEPLLSPTPPVVSTPRP
jgi:protein phosphatase